MNYQKIIKNLLPVVFILWGCFAFSQDTLMLKQAIEIALENNYSIKIIKNKAAIEENKVTRGNAGMLPKIDVIAGDNVSINDTKFELITGDVIEKDGSKSNSLNTSAELTWTLFDGAAMFIAYDKLKMIRELNEVEVQIAIENTVKNVVIAYYETARQQENLNIIGESVKISRARLQRITDRANFGASVKLEILKARVDLNADSSAWLQTELSLANARRNLNFLLARDVNTDFALNTKVEFSVMAPQDELRKSAFERNTLINKALKSKKISELDYRAIRASRYPRISLKSSYGLNQMKSDGGFFVENTSLGFNAGLSASFNIFDGFRKNTQSQNAKIAIQISELMYQEIYSQIDLEVSNAYDAYGKRIGIVKMEEENLITAKQNFERTNDLFKLGQVMSLELREAQLNLIQAKNRRNDAYFRAKVAETELLRLSGKLLEG